MKKLLYGIGFGRVVADCFMSCRTDISVDRWAETNAILLWQQGNIIGFMMPAAFVVPAIYLNVAERK